MQYTVEILNRFASERSCNTLLYTPVASDLTCRESRCYEILIEGSLDACDEFVRTVLADETSDEVHVGSSPVLDGFRFFIDISLKPGLLDLEKEYILRYYRSLGNPGFDLLGLRSHRRVYLLGEDDGLSEDRFVKDMVNSAIHTWRVKNDTSYAG